MYLFSISLTNVIGTHRHTDRQRDRHIDTQTHRHTDRQRDRHIDTQTHRQTERLTYRHTDTQTHRHTERQIHRHTDKGNLEESQTETLSISDSIYVIPFLDFDLQGYRVPTKM